jgi:hypothetical protein
LGSISISIEPAWIFQSQMPSSRANRFFAAAIAPSGVRAERITVER